MAGERSADDIQREIEQSRAALATAIDQLAHRTNPKRLSEQLKLTLRERAQSPQGRAVLGAAGGVVLILVIRRIRKRPARVVIAAGSERPVKELARR